MNANLVRALRAIACAVMLSGTTTALGQPVNYADLSILFDEAVTSSVTGSPQRESEVPAAIRIITAEEIRRSGARDIPGVLSRLAGIDVARRSSEHADVAVRGYNQAFSPRLLVLVDGRQVYADYYGFTPWSTIPVDLASIRQIEVVKGPNGALFGFNAVGGVINIVTYDPLHDSGPPRLTLLTGTQGLAEVSATATSGLGDRGALRMIGTARRSDEFDTARLPGDFVADWANERRVFAADAHLTLAERVVFGVELTWSEVGQFEMPPTYTMSYTDYAARSFRTHWEADTGRGLVKANLYRNRIQADAWLSGIAEPVRRFDNEVLVAQLENLFKVGTRHVLRVAGEYRDNSMRTTPLGPATVSYEVTALSGTWTWNATSRLQLSNSLRLDRWELGREGFLPPEYVETFGLSNSVWDIDRDELSYNSGLSFALSDSGALKFAAGRARQLPNLLSLGGDFSEFMGFFFLGIPWLEPTDVSNYELQWQRRWSGGGLNLTVGAFRGVTSDLQTSFFGNIGSSATEGIEAVIGGSPGDRWAWDLGVLQQRVEDRLTDLWPAESTLVDFEAMTPEKSVKGHFAYTRGNWEVDGFVRYTAASLGPLGPGPGDFTGRFIEIPSHIAFDATLGYVLGERFRLTLAGRNLTRSAQRQTQAPAVERQVYTGFSYGF